MVQQPVTNGAAEIRQERQMLKRSLTLLPLFGIIYFTISGGTFGIESLFSYSGAGMALLLIGLTPFVYSIPNILMVRELQSMMPVEGSYYHWTKQGFNPFMGFMTGWMNWVMSWVDVAIYPVLAASYLGFFIPQLQDGWGGVPGWVLQWIVAIVIIWLISYLQIRGVRLAGLTSVWIGVIILIPLLIMSVAGFYNWGAHGSTYAMSFLPKDTGVTGAFAVGLFVVMWNYMGWELPTSAGDEIVKPKRTYPLAMALVLVAAIATYAVPTVAALYGGAGADNKVLLWGIEEEQDGAGIGPMLEEAGMTPQQMEAAGVDPKSSEGWWLPDIAKAVAEETAGAGSWFASFLGNFMMIAAILSMIGLFIGNSVSATRIPFALSEDGMMPKPLVRVHRKFGTPFIAIILCGVIFSIFSLNAFAALVVIDVLLNALTLLLQFLALWRLRFIRPDIPRARIPGGWIGLFIATILPALIIIVAIVSQVLEEGWMAIWLAAIAIAIGAILYFVMKKWVKPGVPDIDPFAPDDPEAHAM